MRPGGQSKVGTVLRVTSGNFLEMFDFFLFGFYATNISRAFFPADSEFASLMLTFGTFGAGFLMRPLGAVVLGAYVDRIGRRKGLITTLAIMAVGTMLIAFVPGYATIGIIAPLIVLIGRLLQGFSAGVERGGVSVYLSEMATPGHKGFYVSWQSASQQLAIVVAAALGYALNAWMAPATVAAWGWRIPFFVGCLIVPVLFVIRRSLQETPAFLSRAHRPDLRQIFASQLTAADSLIVTFCVGVSNFIWLPVMGGLSDRIGRRPILVAFTVLTILTSYVTLAWLVAAPTLNRMLLVELWLSFLYGGYNGAMVVALTEVMPIEVRTVGFSLAYSLATALFGGFTPAVCTWMIEVTGDKAAPGLWMTASAVCGLAGTWLLYRRAATRSRA